MGTPDFAIPGLNAIYNSEYEIAAVITQPDKHKGRGKILGQSPVKEYALAHKLPLIQPESLNDINFVEELEDIKPDCIVVIAC